MQNSFVIFLRSWNKHSVNTLSFTSPSRRSTSYSWSRTAQVPAQGTCPVWPVCQTSLVAGARLCPAVCCVTAQTSNPALRARTVKGRWKVSAICCWHPSTAPCVKSTQTALLVLRYNTDAHKNWHCLPFCWLVYHNCIVDSCCANFDCRTLIVSGR